MNGFTLVESLVCALILGILTAGIYGVLDVGNNMYYDETGLLELQQNARQGMDLMINELREASNIEVTVLDSDSDQVVFDNYKGIGYQYYRDINDDNGDGFVNQIICEDSSSNRMVLANDVTRLKFVHSTPYLTIEIGTEKTVRQRQLNFSLKENVALRNE
jgi:prepilin-type N-terminal cleavage/methylation domain-containing protein